MAEDKIEQIIREVAAKHGVALGRNDPILILQTLHERLIRDMASTQQEMMAQFKQELELIASNWSKNATDKAERILNAALEASQELMDKAMQDSVKAATDLMKQRKIKGNEQLTLVVKEAKWVAIMNLVAASMVVIAAGMALMAAFL